MWWTSRASKRWSLNQNLPKLGKHLCFYLNELVYLASFLFKLLTSSFNALISDLRLMFIFLTCLACLIAETVQVYTSATASTWLAKLLLPFITSTKLLFCLKNSSWDRAHNFSQKTYLEKLKEAFVNQSMLNKKLSLVFLKTFPTSQNVSLKNLCQTEKYACEKLAPTAVS